nr:integrase, catalytic region, zinc finger, CCHC-type, peptidase aspartic, catalytic [Tanacetum cinerariifolium]
MPSKDNLYNGRKELVLKIRVILKKEKIRDQRFMIRRNLNASYVNEKINFEDDYFQDILNQDFEKIDSPFQQTSSLKPYVPNVILKKIIIDLEDEVVKCDKEENPKVIAPGIFKLSVSQCVSPISMSKSSCEFNNVEIKLKRKRRKRKSSKQNVKQVDNDVSRANNDFVHFLDLDTFSSVRRPKNSSVIWKKKWSSNTSNVGLSTVSVSNLNKNVKRYSRKDLLAYGVDLLIGDRSSNLYTIALNEVASNSSTCLLAKASSLQSWLWHQRLSHLKFATVNNLVKNNPVQGLPKMKFEKDHLCFACEQGKIHQKQASLSSSHVFV